MEIRLAIGLRMLAGGSYLDVAPRFGVSRSMVYTILWEVVDAINNTPEVGPFFFPQTVADCRKFAAQFKVRCNTTATCNSAMTGVGRTDESWT